MNKGSRIITILIFSLIIVLVFLWTAFNIAPWSIARYIGSQLVASVGISVSVPPNPFSELAQQLQEEKISLAERERSLEQREIILTEENVFARRVQRGLVLGGAVLLILILLNFYLDHRRRKIFYNDYFDSPKIRFPKKDIKR